MATAVATPYDECVFINCPFDDEYQPMLHALLFTVVQCGFRPRIATERSDCWHPHAVIFELDNVKLIS